jgi:hypothetical protein
LRKKQRDKEKKKGKKNEKEEGGRLVGTHLPYPTLPYSTQPTYEAKRSS